MAKQEQVKKQEKGGAATPEVKANPETIRKGKELKGNIDEVLDKIDDVLEENAEEFVKNYIQKGGQ